MFRKLLIANRGEIACRVMTTAQRLGIATVAVYSDADVGAKHVAMADEAVRIGPAAAAESYLKADAVIQAAVDTGSEAIHPGYGFLSENPEFVEAVEAAGVVFVGPPASAIRAMGLKDAAKALMEKAGVPVVPGYHNANQDADFLAAKAREIGYPVLIKARAGGGGRGMRLVARPEDFLDALASAQREAQAAFGDPRCLIEKFITTPRHIEIQVLADTHGNVVHLWERDCSLQRRHQKVIEEAPAPHMPDEVREAMGRAAVEAARAIGYTNAGTVEFIVDGSGPLRPDGFWFMEMNTRLQVEHPVTEAIFWADLVDWQLRVATGEPIPFIQDELEPIGWAFEARIYAEDAARGFLPATGTLEHLTFPAQATAFGHEHEVRVDAGVRAGDAVSPHYDPMIAKVIARGMTRDEALNALARALDDTHIAGTTTNLAFLKRLIAHDAFRKGNVDTGLIERDIETLIAAPDPTVQAIALAAIAAATVDGDTNDTSDPWHACKGWQAWADGATSHIDLTAETSGSAPLTVSVTFLRDGRYRIAIAERDVDITLAATLAANWADADSGRWRVTVGDHTDTATIIHHGAKITVVSGRQSHTFVRRDAHAAGDHAAAAGDIVTAPMPGLVKRISVAAGDHVAAGAPIAVLEAMKMEHTLTAPRDGVVAAVSAREGDTVEDGSVVIAMAPTDEGEAAPTDG